MVCPFVPNPWALRVRPSQQFQVSGSARSTLWAEQRRNYEQIGPKHERKRPLLDQTRTKEGTAIRPKNSDGTGIFTDQLGIVGVVLDALRVKCR